MTQDTDNANKQFRKVFTDFVEQYYLDMHGDSKINGGNKGMVGNLRELKASVAKIQTDMKSIKDNPAFKFGELIVKYPWVFRILVVFLFLVMNAWFISDFRNAILASVGLPPEVVLFWK